MKKVFCIALILSFLTGTATVSRAFSLPQLTQIATLEELEAFGRTGVMGKVTAEIKIDRPVTLNGIEGGLATYEYPIHILSGGSLTVDSPALELLRMGSSTYILVDAGGTLRLNGGTLFGAKEPAVLVAEGGTLEIGSGFTVEGALVPGWTPPVTPEPEPEPEPEPAPITDLWGEVRKIHNGALNFAMTLPRLEMREIEAIHVWRSADGEAWEEREVFRWNEERGYVDAGPDSRCAIQFGESGTYLAYVEDTDYQDFYLRLEVEGTPYAGQSNVVKVEIPVGVGPGEDAKPPTTGDYEDNDGNRGGGGQGESDRVDKLEPTPTPTPTSTPMPTPEASPEPLPEQESLSVPTPEVSETPVSTPEPEPAPSQKIHDVISLTKPARPAAEPPPQKESPEPETATPAPTSTPKPPPVPTPESTPAPSPTPQPTVTVQPEKGSGDMLWLAGGLTLVVVVGGAVLLFLKRKP